MVTSKWDTNLGAGYSSLNQLTRPTQVQVSKYYITRSNAINENKYEINQITKNVKITL